MAAEGFIDTVFVDGIKHPNFFNGRLLTAEDMTQESRADHQHLELLGQAAGAGVVSGLWVTAARSTLTVSAGLAVNREGAGLRLGVATSFDIAPTAERPAPADVVFRDCHVTGAPVSATAAGPYLLAIGPAWRFEGAVPMKEVAAPRAGTVGCGRRWRVEGVGFALVPLAPPGPVTADSRRRNRLAHWLLGTDRLRDSDGVDLPEEPLLDTLPGVERHLVPLALVYWSGSAIEFADNWAARRRLTHPPATLPWGGAGAGSPPLPVTPFGSWVSDWRLAAAQARFLQFQDQVGDLAGATPPAPGYISQHFRFLPPLGFVPISGASTGHPALAGRSPRGLHLGTFLGVAHADLQQASREAAAVLHDGSLGQEALDLDAAGMGSLVSLFQVLENAERVAAGRSPQYYVLFAKQAAAAAEPTPGGGAAVGFINLPVFRFAIMPR